MISTNIINLIVEQNNISIIMKIKKYLKKFNQLSNQKKIFQLFVKLTICFKEHCKMQNKFSNIYILFK